MSTETQTEVTGTQLVTTEEKGQQAFTFVESVKPGAPKKKKRLVTTARGRELAAFGKQIAERRKEMSLTQAALARLAGVQQAALSQVESGTSGSKSVITLVCVALHMDIPASVAVHLRDGAGRVSAASKKQAAAVKRAATVTQNAKVGDERRQSVIALLTLVRSGMIDTSQAADMLLR